MTTAHVADTGVFVRCGSPGSAKFERLRRAVRRAGTSLLVPRRVYEELGGDPAAEAYSLEATLDGLDEAWVEVAGPLDHERSLVSTVMDQAVRFIANETSRPQDEIETADPALVGLAAQLLESGEADDVVLLTTDKPAGRAAETILPRHGYDRITYCYASEAFLEDVTAADFS